MGNVEKLRTLKNTLNSIDRAIKRTIKLTSNFTTTKLAVKTTLVVKATNTQNKDAVSILKYDLEDDNYEEAAQVIAGEFERPSGDSIFALIKKDDENTLKYALMSAYETIDYCQNEHSNQILICSRIDYLISEQDFQNREVKDINYIINSIADLINAIN